jgi:protein gp37
MSKIEWTDETWNPISGCTPISEGCEHCYAERMASRLAHIPGSGYDAENPFAVTLHLKRQFQPSKWKKPRRVFVCSMGDLFHDDVPFSWITDIWHLMERCPQHTFQILTKRPERMREFLVGMSGAGYEAPPLPNVWLGVTAENQQRFDERIPILLDIPAALRFVSVEPMLGPIEFSDVTHRSDWVKRWGKPAFDGIHWVICGADTGPGARKMIGAWAWSLRDQCAGAGVPFFFKKWGTWHPFATDGSIDGQEWRQFPGGDR